MDGSETVEFMDGGLAMAELNIISAAQIGRA
jgi:hypothetical protein